MAAILSRPQSVKTYYLAMRKVRSCFTVFWRVMYKYGVHLGGECIQISTFQSLCFIWVRHI